MNSKVKRPFPWKNMNVKNTFMNHQTNIENNLSVFILTKTYLQLKFVKFFIILKNDKKKRKRITTDTLFLGYFLDEKNLVFTITEARVPNI